MMDKDISSRLSGLNVGDRVSVNGQTVEKIIRLTKTMIIVGENEMRFNRFSGLSVGDCGNWSYRYCIEPVTEELIKQLKEKKIRAFVRTYQFNSLTFDKINKIYEMLKGFEK